MTVKTAYFGQITIDSDKLIEFPNGIIGFPDLNHFALIHDSERENNPGIRWLQSMDEPNFALPVIDPLIVKEDYAPAITEDQFDVIGACDEPLVLVTMIIPADLTKMSVNLCGPLIINPDSKRGIQIAQSEYQTKFFVYDLLKERQEHYKKVWKEHDMTAREAWELYRQGVKADDFEESKKQYAAAIHRMRQATKEGYMLCRVEKVLQDINALPMSGEDKAAVISIIREGCE